jgi:C-terminal processing protease CtpA/Prc
MPGGGRVRIVTEHDFYPDGRQFVGVGVLPDIEVHQTVAAFREGRDLVLETAIREIGEHR